MIYVVSFWGQDFAFHSLEEAHNAAVEEQGTSTPEYTIKVYEAEVDYILRDVPKEFHNFIREEAWEQGHSSRESEVNNIARDLASKIKKCCSTYKQNLWAQFISKPNSSPYKD